MNAQPDIAAMQRTIARLRAENEDLQFRLDEMLGTRCSSIEMRDRFGVYFTPSEANVLALLLKRQGRTVPHGALCACANTRNGVTESVLRQRITQVRRKLRDQGVRIENEYGTGYRLTLEPRP